MFETKRLIIRAFDHDTDALPLSATIRKDFFTGAPDRAPIPIPKDIIGQLQSSPNATYIFFATIALKPEDKPVSSLLPEEYFHTTPIGTVALHHAQSEPHVRQADLGISIVREYQSQGYGTEAVKWMTNHAFREMGFHRLKMNVMDGHTRLFITNTFFSGFTIEGRLRKSVWKHGGKSIARVFRPSFETLIVSYWCVSPAHHYQGAIQAQAEQSDDPNGHYGLAGSSLG